MRLWSLHPKFLDRQGLLALWREGLLARAVLACQTKGYLHHPQLKRFRDRPNPLAVLDCYLSRVVDEATTRGYHFDRAKITYCRCRRPHLLVTDAQLMYEWRHLLGKLEKRDWARWRTLRRLQPKSHPCFRVETGEVADWERA